MQVVECLSNDILPRSGRENVGFNECRADSGWIQWRSCLGLLGLKRNWGGRLWQCACRLFFAKARAIAAPMPREAPVTTANLPWSGAEMEVAIHRRSQEAHCVSDQYLSMKSSSTGIFDDSELSMYISISTIVRQRATIAVNTEALSYICRASLSGRGRGGGLEIGRGVPRGSFHVSMKE